jgi:hypothetical protein
MRLRRGATLIIGGNILRPIVVRPAGEDGLKAKIPQGKKVITDRVYGANAEPDDHALLALPNPCDDPLLANFKARVRSRHESFNGRLKFFRSLADT